MIEPEIAFADLADDCALAEDFLRYLVSYALEHCTEDLAFFNERVEPGLHRQAGEAGCGRVSDTSPTPRQWRL